MTRVCFSGNGQGEIAAAIKDRLQRVWDTPGSPFAQHVYEFVDDQWTKTGDLEQIPPAADVAICTTGGMLIRRPEDVSMAELERLYQGNFWFPRMFTERHILRMSSAGVRGLIIHLGSNAAWYGNPGADDYGAFKAALRKYCELRRRTAKAHGIRICCLGFGGVDTAFWAKATKDAPSELAATIVPGARKALTAQEVAEVVLAVIQLPPNVALSDALITSVDYQ